MESTSGCVAMKGKVRGMRGPLFILIPVGALLMTGVIGVGIGLLNLAIRDAFDSALGPVIFGATLTVLIMAVATWLSWNSPDPED